MEDLARTKKLTLKKKESSDSSRKAYPAKKKGNFTDNRKPATNNKKRSRSDDDSDDDYKEKEPAAKRTRWTFPKKLRQDVLSTAPVNKHNYHVCPPCGRPLMSRDTQEEVIAPWAIKENKEKGRPAGLKKVMVSAQLDHYFNGKTWAEYYDKKKKEGESEDSLKKAYLDKANLRPMCYPCNVGHKYEGKKINLLKDYSKDGYESTDEDRQEDVYDRIKTNKPLLAKIKLLTKYPRFKAAKKSKKKKTGP